MNYLVQALHSYLTQYLQRITGQGIHYEKAVSKLRQISSGKFEAIYKKPDYWSILNDSEREVWRGIRLSRFGK